MKPLAGNVLVAPAKGAYTQETPDPTGLVAATGGRLVDGSKILRPETEIATKPSEGIVRAIGRDVTLDIAEGDRVLYRSWTGIECRIQTAGQDEWVDHQLTPQRDILAIVEPGERIEVISRPMPAPQQKRPFG